MFPMDEKLPETASTELVTMASAQVALFDDPTRLLNLTDPELAALTAALHGHVGGIMPTLRRQVALVAWAEWHRRSDGSYHGWLEDTATLIGVDSSTVVRWRRAVVRAEHLVIPGAAQLRSNEQITAGQSTGGSRMHPAAATAVADDVEVMPGGEETSSPAPPSPRPGRDRIGGPPVPRDEPPPVSPTTGLPYDPDARRVETVRRMEAFHHGALLLTPVEAGAAMAGAWGGVARAKELKEWACKMYGAAVEAAKASR